MRMSVRLSLRKLCGQLDLKHFYTSSNKCMGVSNEAL